MAAVFAFVVQAGKRSSPADGLVLWVAGAVVLLLVVWFVVRRRSRPHVYRTICLACRTPFEAPGPVDFLGFRRMACSYCCVVDTYPMRRGYAAVSLALSLLMVAGLVQRAITVPIERWKWQSSFALLIPIAFGRNVLLWRRLRSLAAQEPRPIVLMERVLPSALPRVGD